MVQHCFPKASTTGIIPTIASKTPMLLAYLAPSLLLYWVWIMTAEEDRFSTQALARAYLKTNVTIIRSGDEVEISSVSAERGFLSKRLCRWEKNDV